MNAQLEDVMDVVRSCLLTSKHAISISKLNQDYKLLEDRNVPYKSLGFSTLEAFIQRVPGIRTMNRGGELWLEAIPTEKSAHIARLVAGQKTSSSHRRPQRFRQVPPARRPQAMSRSSNQARNRSGNTGSSNNRGSSNNTTPAPRPLMAQPARMPLMSVPVSPPSRPRYNPAANASMASPSKRRQDRSIQPHQQLDYANKSVAEAALNKPKAPPPLMQAPPAMKPPQNIAPTTPLTPNTPLTPFSLKSGPTWPAPPVTSRLGPSAAPPQAPQTQEPARIAPLINARPQQPPLARTRLCDRLVISQAQSTFNTAVTNGNGGIKVTFQNVRPGGDAPLTPISPSQDPRDDLLKLVRNCNLQEPIYKTRPVVGKNGVESGVYGQVSIGASKFSSYPEEAKTEKEAEILAARKALAELIKERGSKFMLRQTSDKLLIKNRVLVIIDQHNGVFTHKIPAYYQELYNENLPENWLDDTEKWTEVETEIGVDKSKILRRKEIFCPDMSPSPIPPTPDKVLSTPSPLSPKVDKVLLGPIGRWEPSVLKLPSDRYWVAYVTTVINTAEIWVRLVDENYSEQYEVMSYDMVKHYTSTKYPVTETVEVGGYYALEDGECWQRVRVIECDVSEGEADVFFIDIGDEDTVPIEKLVPLDSKFCLLSAQALKVALAGLEDFSDCIEINPRLQKILHDGIFYAEDLSREITEDGPFVTAVFYDTNGPEDVNVNELIVKKITTQLITSVPKLEVEGHITEVHISHVEENGDVFIQVKNTGMSFLVKMLNKLTLNGLTAEDIEKGALKTVDRTKCYFARCTESGNWYRAKIIDADETPRGLKTYLIDFGRTIFVPKSNILQLEILSPFLAKFPAQAIRVRLNNIEDSVFDDKMVARLVELAPPKESLLLKVVKPSYRGSAPTVELFKRIEPGNALVSINNTLALQPQLSKTNGDGNNNVRPRRRVERTNSKLSGDQEEAPKGLKPPKIPGIGSHFDVHVTMAANPGNLTVQPFETREHLRLMMAKLQEVCSAAQGTHLSLDSIREGRLYAAQHVDKNWYRVCVSNVINEHMVTVYFTDYGDVTVVSLDKLQRLPTEFTELPYQAIKAKLVGVQPINLDWSAEDAVRFQDLVVERAFVSEVKESLPDRHSPGDTVLGLKLIDTSSSEYIDVDIGELLVKEKRATFTD